MNKTITLFLLLITATSFAQEDINWDGKYKLQLSDFKSPATQIGDVKIYSINGGAGIEFFIAMNTVQLLFTKNFNSKVATVFKPKASSLVAPDKMIANDLIDFANYQFDLAELHARKLRKRIYEEKDTFSNITFFKAVYDEIQNELSEKITIAGKETDLGRNKKKSKVLQEALTKELETLSNFCKECKVLKKKK